MKVNAEITGKDLARGLGFYGETHADEKVIEQLNELSEVLEEVFWELGALHDWTKSRPEYSANKINNNLKDMRKNLIMIMAQPEDADILKDILYEIEEEVE